MRRLLAPAPDDWTGLTYPGALAVNEVDVDGVANVAVYVDDDDPLDEDGWAATVAAYEPVVVPTGPSLTDVAATIEAAPDLTDDVRTALLAVIAALQVAP